MVLEGSLISKDGLTESVGLECLVWKMRSAQSLQWVDGLTVGIAFQELASVYCAAGGTI